MSTGPGTQLRSDAAPPRADSRADSLILHDQAYQQRLNNSYPYLVQVLVRHSFTMLIRV